MCPILSVGGVNRDCVREECKWWDNENYTCSVVSINKYMCSLTKDGYYDLKDIIKAID